MIIDSKSIGSGGGLFQSKWKIRQKACAKQDRINKCRDIVKAKSLSQNTPLALSDVAEVLSLTNNQK